MSAGTQCTACGRARCPAPVPIGGKRLSVRLSGGMRRACLTLVLAAIAEGAAAADGELDPAFGNLGVARAGLTTLSASSPRPSMLVQADGGIVVCATRFQDSSFHPLLARFTPDGALDAGFSFDGLTTVEFGSGNEGCSAVTRQSDGRIVMAGFATLSGVGTLFAIARLDADGSLDETFGGGTGKVTVPIAPEGVVNAVARAVTIQADGRIVVAGSAMNSNFRTDFALARLLPDGSRDTSFHLTGTTTIPFDVPGETASAAAAAVAIDDHGRIVVAGTAGSRFAVARLSSNGTPDGDFDGDGRTTIAFPPGVQGSAGSSMALQRDGRIVLAGRADSATTGTGNPDFAAARLLPDGSPDYGFGFMGRILVGFDLGGGAEDAAYAIVEQSDGKLLLAGFAAREGGAVGAALRLTRPGDVDPQFGSFGKRTYDLGFDNGSARGFCALALQGARPVAAGLLPSANGYDIGVARLAVDVLFANGFER